MSWMTMTDAKKSARPVPAIEIPRPKFIACGVFATIAYLLVTSCGSQPNGSQGSGSFGMMTSGSQENPTTRQSPFVLAELKLSDRSVTGGAPTTVTLNLAQPAPSGGLKISLTSSEPAIVQIPSSVVVAEGESDVSFPVATSKVTDAVSVAIQAQYAGSVDASSISGTNLSVLPLATAPFKVAVSPAVVTVQQGKSGSSKVTTKVTTGFDHSLQLKASGEPSGVALTLKPAVIAAPGSGTSTLSINVASSVQTGSYPLTMTASAGSSSSSAKATLNVISGSSDPDATFKGCWFSQSGKRYQAVDVSVGNPGTYTFNAVLYNGTTCNANDFADQFGFGQLLNFGDFTDTFWFTDFAGQTDMSALWYVGDQESQCVNYETAPNC
jgi:hypothetical protein